MNCGIEGIFCLPVHPPEIREMRKIGDWCFWREMTPFRLFDTLLIMRRKCTTLLSVGKIPTMAGF